MLDAAIDTAETAVRGPAAKYAAATGIGYAASHLRRVTEPYQDGPIGGDAFLSAGAVMVEEYLGTDPVAFTGFVSGAALADRHAAADEGDDGQGGDGAPVAALLEP